MRARFLALAATAAALLTGGPAPAAAQTCVGGTLQTIEIRLPDGSGGYKQVSDPDLVDYFNLAHCVCPADFAARLQLSGGDTTQTQDADIWVGTDCESAMDLATRQAQCKLVTTYTDIVNDLRNPVDLPISAGDLMFPVDPFCGSETATRSVYLLADDDNPNDTTFTCSTHTDIAIDTEPPPEAASPEALPGENSIVLRWSTPGSRGDDVKYFQVLCERVDGADAADDFPRADPEYVTAMSLCGADDLTRLTDGGGTGVPDTPLTNLDVSTVCGTATGTETSIQVTGLANGVAYRVALLSVDDAQNVSGVYLGEVTPQPVKDFWEDYHDKGGQADGGFCLGVTRGGGGPFGDLLVVLAAAWLAARSRTRRIRARAAGLGAAVLVLALGTASAHAQGYDPYWERWDDQADETAPVVPHWTMSLQGGPYRPAVDDEFTNLPAGETPPFAAMFGTDDNFFGAVELQRYFLFPYGQLGAYASLGLTSQRANAFQVDANGDVLYDPDTGKPVRAAGNRVIFRLVPTSVGAVYRLTALDDRFHVPVVPYAKLGLSYYIWWVRAPDGSFAEVPTPDCMDLTAGDCHGDRARGATIGWQASIGLALRAERLDPDAARNLREEGIEHAGFFAELLYAKVDQFGGSHRLHVGDSTWLVGVNFEF